VSLDENKAVVRRFLEAQNRGDLEAMLACWFPDAVNHGRFGDGPPPPEVAALLHGRDGLARVLGALLVAFPDRRWEIADLLAEGDRVACRLHVSGTHRGVPPIPVEGGQLLQHVDPVGAPYAVEHVHLFRIADGVIAEHWAVRDDLALLQQLGGVPMK
jgi:predicted ester cyclase